MAVDEDGVVVMVKGCMSPDCDRMLSISRIPGGNPSALADPEHFAVEFLICANCKAGMCDRCLQGKTGLFRKAKCLRCGGEMRKPDIAALLEGR